MKKIALILAVVMLLACVLVACDKTQEESKGNTSNAVSDSTEESKASVEESKKDDEESKPEESKGPEYAEGTVEINRELTATSVTQGLATNELTSTRDDAWGSLTVEVEGSDPVNKLTDGVKSDNGSSTSDYFGTGTGFEVIIDLGEKVEGLADFSAVTAICESWGISVVDSVQFFVSDDGENWLPIADPILGSSLEGEQGQGEWVVYEFKTELEMGVSAQYVKFAINKGGHVWLSEVNVDVYK